MIFRKSKKHPKNFSDIEIDSFIQDLKEKGKTLDNEEILHILRSECDIDQQQSKSCGTENSLEFNKDSSVYLLWTFWEERPEEYPFAPLEFMRGPLEKSRAIEQRNEEAQTFESDEEDDTEDERHYSDSDAQDTDEMSKSEAEILTFNEEINQYAEKVCVQIIRERKAEADEIAEQINLRAPEVSDSELENLHNLGGFKSLEDFEREMNEFTELERMVDDISSDQDSGEQEVGQDNDPIEIVPVDANVMIKLSSDSVRVWLFIIPPRNGGGDVTEKMIYDLLEERGVLFGIDKVMISHIVRNKLYFRLFEIAKGVDPIDGTHGKVIYIAPRDTGIDIREDDYGNVDYKELNLIKSVHKDDVLAEVVPPKDGIDGKTVTNLVVKSREGRFPKIPMGKNTMLNEDKTKLVSIIDGEVTYINGKYNVQRTLTIKGNIDNSTGNVHFSGDLIVMGDVLEGFVVEVEGNLHVMGTVEGAKITCGGNINLQRGVVGAGRAKITAGGYIKSIFLENCRVYAKTHIYAEQIANSEVACDDAIHVTSNKGCIIGGKIIAGRYIEVKVVGNRNNQSMLTEVVLGGTPQLYDQKQSLNTKIGRVDKDIINLGQNISYIESLGEKASPKRLAMLDQLRAQLQLRKVQRSKLSAIIAKLDNQIFNNCKRSRFTANQILSPLNITIGASALQVREEVGSCTAFLSKGEVLLKKF